MDGDHGQASFENWRRIHCEFLPCTLCEHRRGAGDATKNSFCSMYEHCPMFNEKPAQAGVQGDR